MGKVEWNFKEKMACSEPKDTPWNHRPNTIFLRDLFANAKIIATFTHKKIEGRLARQ